MESDIALGANGQYSNLKQPDDFAMVNSIKAALSLVNWKSVKKVIMSVL